MKRFMLATAALLTVAGPLAATAAYADPPQRHDSRGNDNGYRDNDRNDRSDRNDRRDNRRDNDRGRVERWDGSRHNGYTYNGRWNYGAPPAAYVGRPGFQPGYQAWRRGDRLPGYYQSRYRTVDWRRAHYRAPPRGYQYVRGDRGETLLVGIATGVILSVILNGN